MTHAVPLNTLDTLAVGAHATVAHIAAGTGAESAHLARRLMELGFIPGETIRMLKRGTGGEPLAIRVGNATFALRRFEAALVCLQPSLQAE